MKHQVRMNLLVLYTARLEECRAFYGELGLEFMAEQHGDGPEHYAAVLADGTVIELYPARAGRETGDALRLGLIIDSAKAGALPAPGRQTLTDPDGRTVALTSG
jgi:catechol 2,3-dioxygenase-like lactoylglutathione lyase family enzyme